LWALATLQAVRRSTVELVILVALGCLAAALDVVDRLVSRSLVIVDADRYRLLDSIRRCDRATTPAWRPARTADGCGPRRDIDRVRGAGRATTWRWRTDRRASAARARMVATHIGPRAAVRPGSGGRG
jgi:hypothetical protein